MGKLKACPFFMPNYRHPDEQPALFFTGFVIVLILAFSAIPTLCIAPLVTVVFIAVAYQMNKAHHRGLLRNGVKVTTQNAPQLAQISMDCQARLQPGPVEVYVLPARSLNAYTFGFASPKIIVLYSPMLKVMDEDELRFVIGHEMGHVGLGHAWLNTLMGGLSGVPAGFAGAVILNLVFRGWNRACEYSSDRAGLLACGSLVKSISALAQLEVGDLNTHTELQQALTMLEQQDESLSGNLGEVFSTHPMIIKRIRELQKWAASDDYRRLAGNAISK